MRSVKLCYVGTLLGLLLLCFSTVAMAAYNPTEKILSRLQGEWYDSAGNVVLNFAGDTVNGCKIVGAYNPAGGSSDFSCLIRIIENGEYRDLPIIAENLGPDNYHAHVILNGDNRDENKGTLLMRTITAQYQETVGGIGIDMPEKEVLAKYGQPDVIGIERGVPIWKYQSLGLELSMRHQRVWIIKILRNGNRHFDRTGFNCANAPYEFQEAYSFNRVPAAGTFGAFCVGHGEYMWFDNYPNSITLSTFWN